jgi:hypothetical protein
MYQGQAGAPMQYLDQYVTSPEQPMVASQFGNYYYADQATTQAQDNMNNVVQSNFAGQERMIGARRVTREEMIQQGLLHTANPIEGEGPPAYLVQQEQQQQFFMEPQPQYELAGEPQYELQQPQYFYEEVVPARQPARGVPVDVETIPPEQQYYMPDQFAVQQGATVLPAVGEGPPMLGGGSSFAPQEEFGQASSSMYLPEGRGASTAVVPDSGIGLDNRFLKKWWPWEQSGGPSPTSHYMTDMVYDFDPQAFSPPPTGPAGASASQQQVADRRLVGIIG